jgi:glycosyltransferase involved in cell wall biosynthesis
MAFGEWSVAVVVPAHNEEDHIGRVLETMPGFVDAIVVVDDASTDGTSRIVGDLLRDDGSLAARTVVLSHPRNRGVGAAIATGYEHALDRGYDLVAVMGGDGQMNPDDLPALLRSVGPGVEYVKGNRFQSGKAWQIMPRVRFFGIQFLSLLTKLATGYWGIGDSQCGYTVIGRGALALLPLGRIYPRYGVPNDLLLRLSEVGASVADVPIEPIYGDHIQSGVIWPLHGPKIVWLLWKGFWRRLVQRYLVRDFHPVIFLYAGGFLLTAAGFALGVVEVVMRVLTGGLSIGTTVLVALLCLVGLGSLGLAVGFDRAESERGRDGSRRAE